MQEFLSVTYYWLKAGHVIFVIFWMAGLFILPRQMVYMHSSAAGSAEEALWAERTRTLARVILTPSILVTWVLGLALVFSGMVPLGGWFHAKLLLVLGLSGYHGWMMATARKMAGGERPLAEKQLRLLNEVPAIIAIVVVILVIVKPF